MFHFLNAGGNIGKDHLRYLREFFDKQSIRYDTHEGILYGDELIPGDCYLSCSVAAIDANPIELDRVFQVQLAHNLTGIKGSPLKQSDANLNIMGGRKVAEYQNIDLSDPRFVVGGYAKWDRIYPERFKVQERRSELSSERGLDESLPWVCFYPTGPNDFFRGGMENVISTFLEVEKKLGTMEFLICDHDQNKKTSHTRKVRAKLIELLGSEEGVMDSSKIGGTGKSRAHLIDGGIALKYITACDLFITDIASTMITALSMKKPLARLTTRSEEHKFLSRSGLDKGMTLDDIDDLGVYIDSFEMTDELNQLFKSCVEFDDDKNCERITALILSRYEDWRKSSS